MKTVLERMTEAPDLAAGPPASPPAPGLSAQERALLDLIAAELSRLLNTRIDSPAAARRQRTVIDYGITDWSGSDPLSEPDKQRIARDVERAIRQFEPRLRDPRVEVLPSAEEPRFSVALGIEGRLGAGPAIRLFADMKSRGVVQVHG